MLTDKEKYDPPVKRDSFLTEKDFLLRDLPKILQEKFSYSDELLQRILKENGIFIDKKRPDFNRPQTLIPQGSPVEVFYYISEQEDIPVTQENILFEDEDLLAYNKPSWLPTQGTKVSSIFSLEYKLKQMTKNPQLMAAHRLDRQTSGLVLFGKSSEACGKIMKKFSSTQVQKKYWAVVAPPPTVDNWTTEGYICRDFQKLPQAFYFLSQNEKPKSKWSSSFFQVLKQNEKFALIEATPKTGRTHQLRVHLKSSGCPIIGDFQYGAPRLWAGTDVSRIQLHAKEIILDWKKEKSFSLNAPLPGDFILI